MNVRKSHRKSHKGCNQCKRRHVRCSEEKPDCAACSRLDLPCSYGNSPRIPTNWTGPQSSAIVPGFTLLDMKLLHHYHDCSCVRFAPQGLRHKCWTSDVPRIAFAHSFLLHQMLAVAALHGYVQEPGRRDLRDAANSHRALALELVQPAFSSDASDLGIPLFAFAGLTAIYAFAELVLHLEDDADDHDIIGSMLTCFRLTRGINTLVHAHRSSIEGTWAGDMINLNANEALQRSRQAGLRFEQSRLLEKVITERITDSDELEAYLTAANGCLRNIEVLMSRPEQDDEVYHLIMTWPNEVCDRYIKSLERQEPLALVILAHFAVLMRQRPQQWWFTAWPSRVVKAVRETIGEEFCTVLEWPDRMLGHVTE